MHSGNVQNKQTNKKRNRSTQTYKLLASEVNIIAVMAKKIQNLFSEMAHKQDEKIEHVAYDDD